MVHVRETDSALHEAAHAVVAWRYGYPVAIVALTDEGGFTGHTPGRDPLPRAIIAMAGQAADVKWHGASDEMVPFEDHCSVLARGFRGRSLPTLLKLARGAVEEYSEDIELVARHVRDRDLGEHDMATLLGPCEFADDCPRGWLAQWWLVLGEWIWATLAAWKLNRALRRQRA
jgi:hypothetical protein